MASVELRQCNNNKVINHPTRIMTIKIIDRISHGDSIDTAATPFVP